MTSSTPYTYDIAIVGGGAYGTAILGQFTLRKIPEGRRSLRILVLERSGDLGPGMPYSEHMTIRNHIVNIPGGGTQITATYVPDPQQSDFLIWLRSLSPESRLRLGIQEKEISTWVHQSFPRFLVGLYLSNRFTQFVEKLENKGFNVDVQKWTTTTSVTPVKKDGVNGYSLVNSNGDTLFVRTLFIATGHWTQNRFPEFTRWFPSPFPPKPIQDFTEPGNNVGILGCFLSAIDALLTVCEMNGSFHSIHGENKNFLEFKPLKGAEAFKVTMYARKAILPQVRGVINKISEHKYLTPDVLKPIIVENDGVLPLSLVWNLLKREIYDMISCLGTHLPEEWDTMTLEQAASRLRSMRHAIEPLERLQQDLEEAKESLNTGVPVLFQSCFYQSYAIFHDALQYFSAEDRIRFEDVKSEIRWLVSPIPVENAEKILALMRGGYLKTQAIGTNYSIRETKDKIELSWRTKDGYTLVDHHDFMIDATGQKGDYEKDPSPLTQCLTQQNLIKEIIVPFRNIKDAPKYQGHPQVVQRKGIPYFRPPGAVIDVSNYSLVPAAVVPFSPIYYMGPCALGQLAFPYFLGALTTAAERALKDLVKRGIVDEDSKQEQPKLDPIILN